MKYLHFLTICAVTFLPTQVEGTWIYFGYILRGIAILYHSIFFTKRRNERDCKALFLSAGITNTESCYCGGWSRVDVDCDPLNELVCVSSSSSSSNAVYCSNNTWYTAESTERPPYAYSTNPNIETEGSYLYFSGNGFRTIAFGFVRNATSNKYTKCSAYLAVGKYDGYYECEGCAICENGVDFTYNCSNIQVKGTIATGNVTNSTESAPEVPGPKSLSCIPVTSVIPSF